VTKWGWLEPSEINFGSLYRLNTFVLIHTGFWHMLVDTMCLVPLLERFEAEFGTLTSIALFMGRKSDKNTKRMHGQIGRIGANAIE
jgi:GPI-anchor transamidase subunit GAA1